MTQFKRILFPVDFSERCRAAVPSVHAMVQRFGSELTILNVVDLPSPGIGIAPPEAETWATLIGADRMREQGKISLEKFVSQCFAGIPTTTESAEGDPATMICDCAKNSAIDLIMLPTAGLGRFRRFLLGSVTAKVLHDTATPVWTGVHAEEFAAHSPDGWKNMICAIDDQPDSLPVLRWAAEFARDQKVDLRLVHAIVGPEDWETDPKLLQFLADVAFERIAKLQADAGTKLEVCMEVGPAARIVRQAAMGHSADLVVIGRGVIQKPFGRLRSAAYEIIRESPCPVISV
jgi:nucleotide-binding universal stress UspA family protein